jgi:hypothetical protein
MHMLEEKCQHARTYELVDYKELLLFWEMVSANSFK